MDETIAADLKASAQAMEELQLATHEHRVAMTAGDWERAEDARQRAVAQFEVHLDALTRANRRLEMIGGG